jgi:Ser/Thr protein kinase RdoA (MazF antagonist)
MPPARLLSVVRAESGLDLVELSPTGAGESGTTFWVKERLPGSVLESSGQASSHPALAQLMPELIRLNDAQAGLGDGHGGWPELPTGTLTHGGDGYCLHSTLADRPGLRDLLEIVRRIGDSCGPAIPAGRDFVHFDFTLANLLTDGVAVTGVIDVNPPLLTGDRAFDLATLAGRPGLPGAYGAPPGRLVGASPSAG